MEGFTDKPRDARRAALLLQGKNGSLVSVMYQEIMRC